jgi:hypothetical protein
MSPVHIDTLSRRLAQPASRRRLLALVGVGAASTTLTAAGLNETLAKKKNNKSGGKGKGNKGDTANIGPFNTMTDIPLSAHQKGRNFKGTLSVVRFEERSGSVVAIGTITGKVTGKGKGNKPVTAENVVIPVSFAPPVQTQSANGVQAQATCQILDLTLGPIDLNLLGLRLQVNQIHIQLTAQQGGGLLGDLLCAIANLLNGGILGQILNQLLGLLNQLLTLPGI